MTDLKALFGHIDIYLFDQLLRGRIPAGTRICDAGCGSGRNLVFFLREGYDVRAADADHAAVDVVRSLAATFSMGNPVKFHAADGWGYRFVGDLIARVDPINSALSARLATS